MHALASETIAALERPSLFRSGIPPCTFSVLPASCESCPTIPNCRVMITNPIYVPAARFVKCHRGAAPLVALAAAALLLLLGLAGCSGLIASKTSTPATATLTANPATLNFGDVALGNDSTQNSTLTNTGNSKVTVSGVAASSSEFMVSGVPGGTTLSSGQSAVLTVTFKPSNSGNATGTITISSNANNSPIITLLGASPSPHSVGLTWSPSTSPVVGYYVYRGTVTNGPYAKLNLVAATQFTDLSVQAGQTYTYVVTAVDANITESSYSNPATATVPSP